MVSYTPKASGAIWSPVNKLWCARTAHLRCFGSGWESWDRQLQPSVSGPSHSQAGLLPAPKLRFVQCAKQDGRPPPPQLTHAQRDRTPQARCFRASTVFQWRGESQQESALLDLVRVLRNFTPAAACPADAPAAAACICALRTEQLALLLARARVLVLVTVCWISTACTA